MMIDTLRVWHRADPFCPFAMRTGAGDSIVVHRPDALALSAASGDFVVVDGPHRFGPIPIAQINEVVRLASPHHSVVQADPDLFA